MIPDELAKHVVSEGTQAFSEFNIYDVESNPKVAKKKPMPMKEKDKVQGCEEEPKAEKR